MAWWKSTQSRSIVYSLNRAPFVKLSLSILRRKNYSSSNSVLKCRINHSTPPLLPLFPHLRSRRQVTLKADFSEANRPRFLNIANKVRLRVGSFGHLEYPSFWLRDNCQCSECIHPETKQRIVDTFSIPPEIGMRDISYGRDSVSIIWSDGHDSFYPSSWLSARRFDVESNSYDAPPLTFRQFESVRSDYDSLPTVSYNDILSSERGVLQWLEKIYQLGFCLIVDVPVEPESTKMLLEKIAFIRHTHYGGFWDFTSDLTFRDTAYTTDFLGAHTDNTYFTDPSRLQLFHLLSHTDGEGGATLLADGFKAAKVMARENPQGFRIFGDTPQPFHSSGNEHVCIQPSKLTRVFEGDERTRLLYRIRWNNYDRAAKADWGFESQQLWYEAARNWNDIIMRPAIEIWMQLQPGTALIFDNWRMLHGRSRFSGKRRMCGGYINNDDFVSRYRLLKLGREKALNSIGVFPDPLDTD